MKIPIKVNWTELAPRIIRDAALELTPDRPLHSETASMICFGTRASLQVNIETGQFYDREKFIGGGLLDMVQHLKGFNNRSQSVSWLDEKGLLNGTYVPSRHNRPQLTRPIQTNKPKQISNKPTIDFFEKGLALFKGSEKVSANVHHPVRKWCAHRKLFHPQKEIPSTIKWHKGRNLIIVMLSTFDSYLENYPDLPEPKQFQLLSIDKEGKKQKGFKSNGGQVDDKRTYGQSRECCIGLFGDPTASEIVLTEGIADALCQLERFSCAIAAITSLAKLAGSEPLMESISSKRVILYGDNDEAGEYGEESVIRALYPKTKKNGGRIIRIENKTHKDPAATPREDFSKII